MSKAISPSPSLVSSLQQPRSSRSIRREQRQLLFAALGLILFYLPSANAMEPVTLTDQRPTATIPLDPQVLAAGTPILEIDVTALSNPSLLPLGVAVYITVGDKKIPVGDFAFYPADKKGNFQLNARDALAQVQKSANANLAFELRKLRQSAPWKPVQVTIAPPIWRAK